SGRELNLRVAGRIEHLLAEHRGLNLSTIFFRFAGILDGERFCIHAEGYRRLRISGRWNLHFARELLSGDQMIVAKSLEKALAGNLDFDFALLSVDFESVCRICSDSEKGQGEANEKACLSEAAKSHDVS